MPRSRGAAVVEGEAAVGPEAAPPSPRRRVRREGQARLASELRAVDGGREADAKKRPEGHGSGAAKKDEGIPIRAEGEDAEVAEVAVDDLEDLVSAGEEQADGGSGGPRGRRGPGGGGGRADLRARTGGPRPEREGIPGGAVEGELERSRGVGATGAATRFSGMPYAPSKDGVGGQSSEPYEARLRRPPRVPVDEAPTRKHLGPMLASRAPAWACTMRRSKAEVRRYPSAQRGSHRRYAGTFASFLNFCS